MGVSPTRVPKGLRNLDRGRVENDLSTPVYTGVTDSGYRPKGSKRRVKDGVLFSRPKESSVSY